MCSNLGMPALLVLLLASAPASAAETPSYSKQIRPFFSRYCLECHSAKEGEGGLNLESYAAMLEGGKHGPVFVAGKADESRIVGMVEGKIKPFMPPKKASRRPSPEEAAVLRAWITAGAKDDGGAAVVVLPEIKPRVIVAAPVAALTYRPDGKLLAASGWREVELIDPNTGDVVGKLSGQTGDVTALAFSRDGLQLAVASGSPGAAGEVRLYKTAAGAMPAGAPVQTIPAHKDIILDAVFSPDGKTLATCGYDRLIKLWNTETGQLLRELKDHSDAVYAVTFSPDGALLASGSADRAIKVWEVADGKRLYTLSDSTDWVYSVAWSPDGHHLAAGGVDKSLRVWDVSAREGRLVNSVFAHEGPIVRVAWSTDGKTLYSVSEDRIAKAWDAGRMVERIVYAKQPEAPLALAVRSDQKQLAVGRYDGVLVLLDEATGKTQNQPLPAKPKPPLLNKATPASAARGQSVRVKLEGQNLDGATEATTNLAGVKAVLAAGGTTIALDVDLIIAADAAPGQHQLTVKTPAGASAPFSFIVDRFNPIMEAEPNDSPRTGQMIHLPATVIGAAGRAGDVDYYRFEAKAGQEVGVQLLTAAVGSKLEPILELTDPDDRIVAESTNGLLGYTCPVAGVYAVGVHDRDYRGDGSMFYRLSIGDIPVVTGVFPLGLQRGSEAEVLVEGVHLGPMRTVHVKAPAGAALGSRLPLPLTTPNGALLGDLSVLVGEFPETTPATGAVELPVPFTANGRIDKPGASTTYRFKAKKGQTLFLEINAHRLGSPLDSTIEILDSAGLPLPRATLRSLSKTFIMFRDHDSASPGIRIENWNDLAVNDYLLVGEELMRINQLPKGPDDDCQFFTRGGQRLGYLGTTPTHHPLGETMYKVALHPAGAQFAPNGLPVVTLTYRNDDGGPGFGKDSRLVFDAPADGQYQVRVGDSRGQGGPLYAYRLTIRTPRPSFNVSFSPTAPIVTKGGAAPVTATADRIDDFDGPIEVRLDNLPPGFSAPPTTIPASENSTVFAIYAEPTATVPAGTVPLKLIAHATINGQDVAREAAGALPKLTDPGDIVTTTEQAEVTVAPGGDVRVTAKVQRRNGFAGRIPVEVQGLPHGVRVLDVGLNGILITEKETTRTFVIHAEPWVEPMTHPFVVAAKQEGKNVEYAAKSVLLRVKK
jgi:WD40 repeat protein